MATKYIVTIIKNINLGAGNYDGSEHLVGSKNEMWNLLRFTRDHLNAEELQNGVEAVIEEEELRRRPDGTLRTSTRDASART